MATVGASAAGGPFVVLDWHQVEIFRVDHSAQLEGKLEEGEGIGHAYDELCRRIKCTGKVESDLSGGEWLSSGSWAWQ